MCLWLNYLLQQAQVAFNYHSLCLVGNMNVCCSAIALPAAFHDDLVLVSSSRQNNASLQLVVWHSASTRNGLESAHLGDAP